MKPINENLHTVTIEDIENHKLISNQELYKDLLSLIKFDASKNSNSFYGNKFQYHFQLKNVLRCVRDKGKSLYDVWNDNEQRTKLIEYTRKRDRGGATAAGNVYECFRANTGAIVLFKATTAKYLYSKFGASSVLDPTAGWGGRMLGAFALNIKYTGIDTNIEMRPAYDSMINFIQTNFYNSRDLNMLWESCLDVDFSKIDYDFVLTSPPYVNMEVYEHMNKWETDFAFYTKFLMPLIDKCRKHIRKGGKVCFNISPKMYESLLKHGYPKCDIEEDLLQQLGQQKGKKKQDKIYIWCC